MIEFLQVVRESLPEIIAAVVSAAVIGTVGFIFRRHARKGDTLTEVPETKNLPERPIEPVSSELIEKAENFLNSVAAGIVSVVRPHQEIDPITVEELYDFWRADYGEKVKKEEFKDVLSHLFIERKLPGLVRRGDLIFIEEEHYSWKTNLAAEDKERIARYATSLINSGDVVALDAGSTTLQIAKCIAQDIREHSLDHIVVVTNFFKAADELLTAALDLGLPDNDSALRLYIIGGRVRLNTLAIVDDDEHVEKYVFDNFNSVLPSLGGADIGFIGTNGILRDTGFTTASESEVMSKRSIIDHSKKAYIVSDPSKFGISQERVFATFSNPIDIITTKSGDRRILRDYEVYLKQNNIRIFYA